MSGDWCQVQLNLTLYYIETQNNHVIINSPLKIITLKQFDVVMV